MTRTAAALATLVLAALAGCGSTQQGHPSGRTLTVLAAASLAEPFTVLAGEFEASHAGVEVAVAFDSSATLAGQAVEGAPADVVATADPRTMQTMVDAGVIDGTPVPFARNELVLVVPPGNPAGIRDLTDLDDPAVDYVVCVVAAPCGALAADLLAENGVDAEPRSYDVDVKAVLTKVLLDEVDAGLVYASDAVAAADGVTEIPLPPGPPADTTYLAARVTPSAEPDLAAAWLNLLRSPDGQDVLAAAGFTRAVDEP